MEEPDYEFNSDSMPLINHLEKDINLGFRQHKINLDWQISRLNWSCLRSHQPA